MGAVLPLHYLRRVSAAGGLGGGRSIGRAPLQALQCATLCAACQEPHVRACQLVERAPRRHSSFPLPRAANNLAASPPRPAIPKWAPAAAPEAAAADGDAMEDDDKENTASQSAADRNKRHRC